MSADSHLVDQPDSKKTRCGLRTNDVPTGWVRWAQAHIDGYGATFCEACCEGVDLAAVDKRLDGDP